MSESSKTSIENSTSDLSHQNHLPRPNNQQKDADNPPFSRLFLLVPRTMNESELNDVFKKFGVIEDVWLVRDRRNREGKGIAYIKYELASEAARAQEEMNGKIIGSHSRPLKVIISSSRREGSVRDPDEHEKMLRLFVLVPKNYSKEDLRKAFEKFGTINNVKVVTDKLTGENKGFGYITFTKASEAARALEQCDPAFKPKFAEPLTSKRHRDREEREEPNSPSSSLIFTTNPSSPSNSTSSRHTQHSSPPVVIAEQRDHRSNNLLQKQTFINESTS
ncbi:unnamed protein product [Didymodactylos carnosus]|uniref:RRM domain-containing protein n=1 Tax=Didymodactylos carnosus TaxID=1234261 RepID=A0A815AL15_9BILA|nr:unnamed protein product [Didymodactylos carnosus]CAF1258207.1 unnamed protein product [Didymodactylos carnosus]CAF3838078.1 unnamed protein product [Didymodactylos carnosus]CAF4033217.1 unnamed protein product [Didymodactylos carnosus]